MTTYMGLSSNVEYAAENINEALSRLANYGSDIQLKKQSTIYLNGSNKFTEHPWLASQVVELDVDSEVWAPEGLLSIFLAIEAQMGLERTSEISFGPKIIDLDLLLFGDMLVDNTFLTIPHPQLLKQAFILVPLQEIAPVLILPNGGTLTDVIRSLKYRVDGNRIWQY